MHIKARNIPERAINNVALKQEPFSRVTPLLKTALLVGVAGGFALATVLTLARAFALPLGPWWTATAQAHGHLQLYGWAGLFVLGVALHFLPRLRGAPLAAARFIPLLLGLMIASLILRAISQPVLTASSALIWRIAFIGSGLLEVAAIILVLWLLVQTARRGPGAATRPAYWSVLPLLFGAFCSFGIAGIVNLINTVQAAQGTGLVLNNGDTLNVTLGLFGFLMPIALAMSARSLPMYAGLEGFPRQVLWPIAGSYFVALLLMCIGTGSSVLPQFWLNGIGGLGMILMGAVILLFIGIFLRLMRARGRVPQSISRLSPSPEAMAHSYQRQIKTEQTNYGPFVALVASSYLWAMLGGLLLLFDGAALLFTGTQPVAIDAIRHSFAIGFIALLICGVAPRMLPSFAGNNIVSPHLVTATLWLGNAAAALRVGAVLLAPLLVAPDGYNFAELIFGLSGPFGLALAICLAINLWPVLRTQRAAPAVTS
ncbi:MAG: hypothetical protein IMW89_19530 [Ktedonobacteraceae bacterium]|nr:hypothetical protein [Ktedonobacteraceae bacterium]